MHGVSIASGGQSPDRRRHASTNTRLLLRHGSTRRFPPADPQTPFFRCRLRPDFADDLDACRAETFRLLARGVADRRSAFHTPALATVTPSGEPRVRTVVLRAFEPAPRRLRLHTDARSGKFAELSANPSAALHIYDPGSQIQVRLLGQAALHTGDAVADAAWQACRPQSRLCYATLPAPGTPIAAPLPAPASEAGGRAHFAVVLFSLDQFEWLWLAAAGHRRARFDWTGADWRGNWLAP